METMSTENQNTVGEILKQGRLRQRLSVAECAKRTHIAPRFIEALEEQRWNELPSESHRLGFLRLYARFLGVSADDVLALYKQQMAPASTTSKEPQPVADNKKSVEKSKSPDVSPRIRTAPRAAWTPSSIPQLIALGIVLLILAWVVYHVVSPRLLDQSRLPWSRRRESSDARLSSPSKPLTQTHKVYIKANSDCWIRVTSANILLYEGILPRDTNREWSGPGPFSFKIGNVQAVSLYWNDQPVDLSVSARGGTSNIRIPPQ